MRFFINAPGEEVSVFFVQQTSETTENRDSNLMKSEISFHRGKRFFDFSRETLSRSERATKDGIKNFRLDFPQTKPSYFHGELAMC